MYVFNAKCNNDVKMQNFIDKAFAKTFESKINSNFVNVLNVRIIKIRKIKLKNILIHKIFSCFRTFICDENIDDFVSHVVKSISIFFVDEKKFAIFEHVFVDMSNAKIFVNFKINVIHDIHQCFVAIDDNNFRIFQIEIFVQTFDLLNNSCKIVFFSFDMKTKSIKNVVFKSI